MQLPNFNTKILELSLMQSQWSSILNPVIANPVLNGNLLQNVSLISGTTQVNHKLGRKLIGWIVVRKRSTGTIYDTQDTNPNPEITLALVSSDITTCDLWVF